MKHMRPATLTVLLVLVQQAAAQKLLDLVVQPGLPLTVRALSAEAPRCTLIPLARAIFCEKSLRRGDISTFVPLTSREF